MQHPQNIVSVITKTTTKYKNKCTPDTRGQINTIMKLCNIKTTLITIVIVISKLIIIIIITKVQVEKDERPRPINSSIRHAEDIASDSQAQLLAFSRRKCFEVTDKMEKRVSGAFKQLVLQAGWPCHLWQATIKGEVKL